jgi:hypothetical protein
VAVTVIACIETVLETYADGPRPIGLAIVEIVVTSIFTVDLALAFYAAQDKLQFSTRLFTIIEYAGYYYYFFSLYHPLSSY